MYRVLFHRTQRRSAAMQNSIAIARHVPQTIVSNPFLM